jgi:hypothetical protein
VNSRTVSPRLPSRGLAYICCLRMAVNFAKLQDFESARAVTMLLTAGRRVPKPSIPAVPALAQQSHTADEQKATEEHAIPDIKTEKPAIGQSYKSHGCPLLGNAARPPPRALGLEPAAEVTERANTGIFKQASGHSIVAKGHFAFANMARHYRSAALWSTRPWRRTDSRISGGFDLGAVAAGDHALVGVGVSNEMIR